MCIMGAVDVAVDITLRFPRKLTVYHVYQLNGCLGFSCSAGTVEEDGKGSVSTLGAKEDIHKMRNHLKNILLTENLTCQIQKELVLIKLDKTFIRLGNRERVSVILHSRRIRSGFGLIAR